MGLGRPRQFPAVVAAKAGDLADPAAGMTTENEGRLPCPFQT